MRYRDPWQDPDFDPVDFWQHNAYLSRGQLREMDAILNPRWWHRPWVAAAGLVLIWVSMVAIPLAISSCERQSREPPARSE